MMRTHGKSGGVNGESPIIHQRQSDVVTEGSIPSLSNTLTFRTVTYISHWMKNYKRRKLDIDFSGYLCYTTLNKLREMRCHVTTKQ